MKVFVLTYPCAEGPLRLSGKIYQTEVHETRAEAKAAADGRMFAQIVECEVGASWQSRTQTWSEAEQVDVEKTLEGERRRCDIFEQEVCRVNGRLMEEMAKVAALEKELAAFIEHPDLE
jgi:hypothetical protein